MPAVKATKLNIANATSRILELERRRFISFAPEKLKFDSPCCPGLVMKWAMPPRSRLGIPPGKSPMQTAFQNKTRENCLFVMFCKLFRAPWFQKMEFRMIVHTDFGMFCFGGRVIGEVEWTQDIVRQTLPPAG